MSASPPYEGRTLIADTSAWVRSRQLEPSSKFFEALRADLIATCAIVRLELYAGTQNPSQLEKWDAALDQLHDYEITRTIVASAVSAIWELSQIGSHGLQTRIGPADSIIAATAAHYGVGVLHDDEHFDRLARVLDFDNERLEKPRASA